MSGEDRPCAHQGCPCPADPGSDYCCEACKSLDGAMQTPCPCHHELCVQAQETAKLPAGTRGVSGSYDPRTRKEDQTKPLLDDWGKSDKH